MIRDNLIPTARYMVPPESDDIASQRVAEYAGPYLAGLMFTHFASIEQLTRALEQGVNFRVFEGPKTLGNGGAYSKIVKLKAIGKDGTVSSLFLWVLPREVTVLVVELEKVGTSISDPSWSKENDELLGE
jgi:hypothetical protein